MTELNPDGYYYLKGNIGGDSSPYITIDENGFLIAGEASRPTGNNAYVFQYKIDPNADPSLNECLLHVNTNKYVTAFLGEGGWDVGTLNPEFTTLIFEKHIGENKQVEYWNIATSTEDSGQLAEVFELSGSSAGDRVQMTSFESDGDENTPTQKWVFTEVPPDEIEDIVVNPKMGV